VLDWAFAPDPPLLERIARCVSDVCRAAEAVCEAFPNDPALRALFGYGALQTECVLKDPGYRPLIPLGRLDSFLIGGSPRFMEFNTDGTAGWHYVPAITALWRERRGLDLERLPLQDRLLQALLACFRQWDKRGVEKPSIAIVDWAGVGTRHEQRALSERFSSWGFPCVLADPRDLRLQDGRLLGAGGAIDLVYRRLVSEEAFARAGEIGPFLDAYLSEAACFVGGFRTDPAWSKALFVVLSDPSFGGLFPPEIRETLAGCIPWTRQVQSGPSEFEGQSFDLQDLLLRQKDRFLLKPERAYEGRGVVAGEPSSPEQWTRGVVRALRDGGWVAQEYLRPEPELIPGAGEAFLQVGQFVLGGRLEGFLPRVSPSALITPDVKELYCPVATEVLPSSHLGFCGSLR